MSADPATFERAIASRLAEIGVLAEAFEEWADQHELPMKTVMECNLMLDELITNIVVHGYQNREDMSILVRIRRDGDGITLHLIDDAPAFNLLEVQPADTAADIEDRDIGGLGIHFVRTLANSVEYQRVAEQNVVTIHKTLSGKPAA